VFIQEYLNINYLHGADSILSDVIPVIQGKQVPQIFLSAIDHVQLAMPAGEEEKARAFYCANLGMNEISKPPELAKRGGCWFVSGDVQLHLGVEADFRPAKKAHPGLRCQNYASLISRLRHAEVAVQEVDDIPGLRRCHIHDPFGNRIELIESKC